MKKTKQSEGKCLICGNVFSKRAMSGHLEKCIQKIETPMGKGRLWEGEIFHIRVEGRDSPQYWLNIEASAKATLKDIDKFLREIWLECCGHLSAFTIGEVSYSSHPDRYSNERGMNIALWKVLEMGLKFHHEYDFGTTTDLTLKVVSGRSGKIKGKVCLLARNEAPSINCSLCGKPASDVCTECIWEDNGAWLCEDCAEKHECGEDMLLPVVNSPRVGMCGYTG